MSKSRHPSFLKAITGTHRRPSTLDVITSCWETDRLIKRSRQLYDPGLANHNCLKLLDHVWSFIGISITYALTVAFNCLLVSLLYGLLAFGAIAALSFLML